LKMNKKKKKYYAVVRGHLPGIYEEWYGDDGAQVQITDFPNALYKGFFSFEDAKAWSELQGNPDRKTAICPESDNKVIIYTDGGCSYNPGPGGYGVILCYRKHRKEVSGGFRLTTNNRMELMACIVGLKSLKKSSSVILFSDSKYVVDGITKGWAKRWQANGWMRNRDEKAVNADLWEKLLDLCAGHEVEFKWVKGHAGHAENEQCDHLAGKILSRSDLPADTVYENKSKTSRLG